MSDFIEKYLIDIKANIYAKFLLILDSLLPLIILRLQANMYMMHTDQESRRISLNVIPLSIRERSIILKLTNIPQYI